MKEGEEAGECGGENGLEGVSRPGAGNASERSQRAKQDSLTWEPRSLAGHRATVHLWWVQRCGAVTPFAHSWPLPDKRQTPGQPGKENTGCQPDSGVTSTSNVSDEDLEPGLPRLFGTQQWRSYKLVLLSFSLLADLPLSPLLF